MKLTGITLTLASLVLSASLLRADPTRTEFSKKGEWTVNSLADKKGNFVGAEMLRTYHTKQEVHLRIGFDGENFHIDSSADWSEIPDAKSHEAEYRIDSAGNESAWKGKAKVIEEADGMTWLRITEPNQPGVGDGIANAKKLLIYVGPQGESVEWNFDLKQSNAAYKDMLKCFGENAEPGEMEEEGKAKSEAMRKLDEEKAAKGAELVEHDYARPGDWAVHYFTDSEDKYVQASMIRYYDGGSILRMTMDATHFHVDMQADWKALGAEKSKVGAKMPVSVFLSSQADLEPGKETATVIDDEGDKWLRISQSFEVPSGMQDGVRNGDELNIVFSPKAKWTFDLKGSHAAWQKVDECVEKFKK